MKKIITPFLFLCIIASVLLSSCSSSNSITKRRYSRGYYISHTKTRHTQPLKHEKTEITKVATPIQVAPAAESGDPAKENKSSVIAVPPVVTANNSPETITAKNKAIAKNLAKPVAKNNLLPAELSVKRSFKAIDKAVVQKNSEDPLSLFWIVILVLLLLFIFGLAGDVLGALIYILLVVCLVLLILWLLRIV